MSLVDWLDAEEGCHHPAFGALYCTLLTQEKAKVKIQTMAPIEHTLVLYHFRTKIFKSNYCELGLLLLKCEHIPSPIFPRTIALKNIPEENKFFSVGHAHDNNGPRPELQT